MKKSFKFFLFFVTLFLIGTNETLANTFYGVIKTNSANTTVQIRSLPNTKSSSLYTTRTGQLYTLVNLDKTADEGGCSNGWYEIYYSVDKKGYMCSTYLDIFESKTDGSSASTACELEMAQAGFPASYWGGLCNLKKNYPNWSFKSIPTNLEWSNAVEEESACSLSYIASTNPTLIDSSCKNQYSSTWYPASKKAVAHYMDPRNFLAPRAIFQFESLKYTLALEQNYSEMVRTVIKDAKFFQYHPDLHVMINQTGKKADIDLSPLFISARILIELGTTDKLYNLYSGIYGGNNSEYYGYYNFYNFGVNDTCATTKGSTVCGLGYAKNQTWNSVAAALDGGAIKIADKYVAKGQYTTYLQKYNIAPTEINKLYNHQYQTNIVAPSSESASSFVAYLDANLIDSQFEFHIPVYNNMNVPIDNSNSGATNDGTKDNLSDLPISTIVTSAGYRYSTGSLTRISPETSVEILQGKIAAIAGKENVLVLNSKSEIVNSGFVGTGYKIKITNSANSEILDIIIKGDTSGDGIVNALDLLQVQKSILGTYTLTESYLKAGDSSGDGVINALDLLQVQKSILKTFNIEQ